MKAGFIVASSNRCSIPYMAPVSVVACFSGLHCCSMVAIGSLERKRGLIFLLHNVSSHLCVYVRELCLGCIQAKAKIYTQDSFLFFKEETALGGIRTHDTPRSRRALYQLSYQGNSAG